MAIPATAVTSSYAVIPMYPRMVRQVLMDEKTNPTEDEKQEKSIHEEQKAQAEHRLRMRFGWDDLIEELIQDGQDRGAFDNLRGQGKPLDLERNPYNQEWDLAHSLMKENDVLPAWIADRNKTLATIDLFRADLQRKWQKYHQALRIAQGTGQRQALNLGWADQCRNWDRQIAGINKQIADFNLRRPGASDKLELFKLSLDEELTRIGASRHLG